MYERLFIRYIPALCVSLNYVPEAEYDDLLSAGRRGVSSGGPGHHGAVHCQVESSLQDEENCETFRGQTGPTWWRQGERQERVIIVQCDITWDI